MLTAAAILFPVCGGTGMAAPPEAAIPCMIVCKANGQALQIQDARTDNLANIELALINGGAGQTWILNPIGAETADAWRIASFKSGRVLDVMGYSRDDGANVQLFRYYGSYNQRWRFVAADADSYHIISVNSGKCLEADENGGKNPNVRQATCRESAYQQWRFEPNPHIGKVYRITAVHSGKVLDIASRSRANGANIQQFQWSGGPNQLWTLYPAGMENGETLYGIISWHSGKVLDVDSRSTESGANVQQFFWHGDKNQLWRLEKTDGRAFRIISAGSGRCLDVDSASMKDDANVQQFDCNGKPNQLWELVEVAIPGSGGDWAADSGISLKTE